MLIVKSIVPVKLTCRLLVLYCNVKNQGWLRSLGKLDPLILRLLLTPERPSVCRRDRLN
jgi:hypothetical protein